MRFAAGTVRAGTYTLRAFADGVLGEFARADIKVEPGRTADMAFTARATGRFPVEEHKPNARGSHSHGEAPLVRVEVYPR